MYYDDVIVGEYAADLLVEELVVAELKVIRALIDVHVPQCRNYLRATGKPVCLPINFGQPKVEIRRIIAPRLSARTIPLIPAYPAHLP